MGLTPCDGDPLVPERPGRLEPRAYATAEAVASAARELEEGEAAFDRPDLIRTAPERGGPMLIQRYSAAAEQSRLADRAIGALSESTLANRTTSLVRVPFSPGHSRRS